jgi:hypothetical protein
MTTAAHAPPHAASHPDAVAGPGWYESSWDLLCGLDVREMAFADGCYTAAGGAEPEPPSAT